MRAHVLGDEVLLDCDLSAQRAADRSGEKIDVTDTQAASGRQRPDRCGAAPAMRAIRRPHRQTSWPRPRPSPPSSASWIARSAGPSTQSERPCSTANPKCSKPLDRACRWRPDRAPGQSPCRFADARLNAARICASNGSAGSMSRGRHRSAPHRRAAAAPRLRCRSRSSHSGETRSSSADMVTRSSGAVQRELEIAREIDRLA